MESWAKISQLSSIKKLEDAIEGVVEDLLNLSFMDYFFQVYIKMLSN